MPSFVNLLRRPVDFGIVGAHPTRHKHIRLVNVVVYVGVVLNLFYLGWFLSLGIGWLVAANLAHTAAMTIPWWLNRASRHRAASIAFSVIITTTQLWWVLVLGKDSELHLVLIIGVAAFPLFFHWKDGATTPVLCGLYAAAGFLGVQFGVTSWSGLTPMARELAATNAAFAYIAVVVVVFVVAIFNNRDVAATEERLQSAQVALVEAEREAAVGRLAAGVAHELNTPLGALRSSADMLAASIGKNLNALDSDEPKQRARARRRLSKSVDLVETVTLAAERIADAATSLQQFAAVDQAQVKPVDLRASVTAALRVAARDLPASVTVDRSEAEELPHVACHPARINQAVLAVLENAVSRVAGDGSVQVDLRVDDDEVVLSITDDGPRPAADEMAAAFEIDFATREGRVGMRLGLPLAKRAVNQAGGTISIVATDEGTTTRIRLPASA